MISLKHRMIVRIISAVLVVASVAADVAWACPDALQVHLRTTSPEFKIAYEAKCLAEKAQDIVAAIDGIRPARLADVALFKDSLHAAFQGVDFEEVRSVSGDLTGVLISIDKGNAVLRYAMVGGKLAHALSFREELAEVLEANRVNQGPGSSSVMARSPAGLSSEAKGESSLAKDEGGTTKQSQASGLRGAWHRLLKGRQARYVPSHRIEEYFSETADRVWAFLKLVKDGDAIDVRAHHSLTGRGPRIGGFTALEVIFAIAVMSGAGLLSGAVSVTAGFVVLAVAAVVWVVLVAGIMTRSPAGALSAIRDCYQKGWEETVERGEGGISQRIRFEQSKLWQSRFGKRHEETIPAGLLHEGDIFRFVDERASGEFYPWKCLLEPGRYVSVEVAGPVEVAYVAGYLRSRTAGSVVRLVPASIPRWTGWGVDADGRAGQAAGRWIGTTYVQYARSGYARATRFQRTGEPIEMLLRESSMMAVLNDAGIAVPVPAPGDEARRDFLKGFLVKARTRMRGVDRSFFAIEYTAPGGYFSYPEEMTTAEGMRSLAENSGRQLGQIIRHGAFHNSLSLTTGPVWVWHMAPTAGIGGLAERLARSNIRASGIAGFDHVEPFTAGVDRRLAIGRMLAEWILTVTYHASRNGIAPRSIHGIVRDGLGEFADGLGATLRFTDEMSNTLDRYLMLLPRAVKADALPSACEGGAPAADSLASFAGMVTDAILSGEDAPGPTVDGFIRQGTEAAAEFRSRMAEFRLHEVTMEYNLRIVAVLKRFLEQADISAKNRLLLSAQLEKFKKGEIRIYGIPEIVKGPDDFFFDKFNGGKNELFLPTDFMMDLRLRGPPELEEELLLHAAICPIVGHYRAIALQQAQYPAHYVHGGKGLLGERIRAAIDASVASQESVEESAPSIGTYIPAIAPSLLALKSADEFAGKSVEAIRGGAGIIHFDVIGGNGKKTEIVKADGAKDTTGIFTPEKLAEIKSVGRAAGISIPIDVHLMVMEPSEALLSGYIRSGANLITLHWEGFADKAELAKRLAFIRSNGCKAGLAVNPDIDMAPVMAFLARNNVELFLQMSVYPGLGGQKFIPEVLSNIRSVASAHPAVAVQIDGGITTETIGAAYDAGARVFVAGSSVFGKPDTAEAITALLDATGASSKDAVLRLETGSELPAVIGADGLPVFSDELKQAFSDILPKNDEEIRERVMRALAGHNLHTLTGTLQPLLFYEVAPEALPAVRQLISRSVAAFRRLNDLAQGRPTFADQEARRAEYRDAVAELSAILPVFPEAYQELYAARQTMPGSAGDIEGCVRIVADIEWNIYLLRNGLSVDRDERAPHVKIPRIIRPGRHLKWLLKGDVKESAIDFGAEIDTDAVADYWTLECLEGFISEVTSSVWRLDDASKKVTVSTHRVNDAFMALTLTFTEGVPVEEVCGAATFSYESVNGDLAYLGRLVGAYGGKIEFDRAANSMSIILPAPRPVDSNEEPAAEAMTAFAAVCREKLAKIRESLAVGRDDEIRTLAREIDDAARSIFNDPRLIDVKCYVENEMQSCAILASISGSPQMAVMVEAILGETENFLAQCGDLAANGELMPVAQARTAWIYETMERNGFTEDAPVPGTGLPLMQDQEDRVSDQSFTVAVRKLAGVCAARTRRGMAQCKSAIRSYYTGDAAPKAVIVYADSILEQGAVIDFEETLRRTALFNNGGTVVVYGRNPRSIELVTAMIKAANNSITSIEIDPQGLKARFSVTEDLSIAPDEGKELEFLIKFANARGLNNGTLLGVIKGSTAPQYAEEVKGVAERFHTLVVSFKEEAKQEEVIYSFAGALRALIKMKNKTGGKKSWFIVLEPIRNFTEAMAKAYEDYRRILLEVQTKA